VVSAKEIADRYAISHDLVSKSLQKLAKAGLIVSQQGTNGGYMLARRATEISISNVIDAIEGDASGLVQCMTADDTICSIFDNCTIKNPLGKIQHNLHLLFNTMKVSEIV
ncbi:MAG TPA: Rrf2 family transcriptional regulator, partial [Bacteroidota bacterium]|nr:Rrf2 family transcriptional regulator [Bacteroidota bacterium]